ncbi:unnamed protein product [Ilex paraguariensis]|uniref:NB-ARC domain-containing protein n=1 Tax=Ilex paraguariensis TaxID=185542 RepID=A0ABC8R481_9AQUA
METIKASAVDLLIGKIVSAIENEASLIGGLSDELDEIKQEFISMRSFLQKCTVISVVGMGGSGKTTLVSKAYNSRIVKRHFNCHAWITVSQKYVVDDLLRRMIEEFYGAAKETVPTNLNTMGFRELVSTLLSYLGAKRYLIILDDVWSSKLWEEINVSLPDEGFGNRVILTTRNENIASSSFGVKSRVHHVKPLGEKEAWELFTMKAFSNNQGRLLPQELEILARNLVNKCEGLPLALVALGSAMSSKKLESEWEKVNHCLDIELRSNSMLQRMQVILLLSFNELPYKLKHCFLYCCLFPEDFVLKRKRLIRLWMAEGFVEKMKGITPEDVAESYLMALIHRNMLQVVKRNISGRPKGCKMDDLLREIALSISEAEKFGALYDDQEASEESGARRLSIQTIKMQIISLKGMLKLRSLLVFIDYRISPSLVTLPSGFRLLRVLDLQDAQVEKLPDELVDLFNLRYLNLRRTRVKELPKSIGRLHNLQTLDIRNSRIYVLPTGTTKLQNLRHLLMYCYIPGSYTEFTIGYGISAPSNIYKLENLQVLDCVEAEVNLMRRIRSMTQLTRIGISKLREADAEDLCIAIQNMNLLRYLFLMVSDEAESLRLDALPSAPPCLKSMLLAGKLETVPRWFQSLRSLTQLYLHWSRLTQDLLPFIQALPCLGKLALENAYSGKQLRFEVGFQKLKSLFLFNLPQLNEIIIERGVMPDLRQLHLENCIELKMLPHGIECLANLQEVTLIIVSSELIQRIRGEQSIDRPKVQHIPNIVHYYRSISGVLYYESLS